MKQILLFFIVLSVSSVLFATDRHYNTEVAEGQWFYKGNRLQCMMSQSIPYFGEVHVIQQHVQQLRIEMDSWHQELQGDFAEVSIIEPVWKRPTPREETIAKIAMQSGRKSIVLDSDLSQKVMAYLSEGYTTRFKFNSVVGNGIKVDIESTNFQKPYKMFANCQRTLLGFALDDVKHTTIYFPVNGTRLTKADIDHLMRIREYVLADPKVTKVVIRGFSDAQGRKGHNNYLSELRAKAIYKYIMMKTDSGKGIDKKKVKLDWFGEKYPLSANDSSIGQALNRRVTIDLYVDYP